MGKLKLIVMVSLIGVCAIQTSAQITSPYAEEALKFSQTNWLVGSTARMQGLAGTQNSLGGDISSIHANPAGLGFYNRSAAGITMGLGFQNSDDSFAGLTTPNFNNTFNISNAGVVMNFNKGRFSEDKFKGGSLGISIARVNDFNRQFRYEGESGSSIVDFFVDQAYELGIDPSVEAYEASGNFLLAGAYHQFLFDLADLSQSPNYMEEDQGGQATIVPQNVNGANGFSTPFGSIGGSIPYQQENVIETGSQNQINFSWGGNYDDKIYFGAGLAVQTLYNKVEREFVESDFLFDGTPDPWINSIALNEEIISRGTGINTTFGIIVRPIDFFTAGISYESPTYLTINQESTQDMAASWGDYFYEDVFSSGETFDLLNLDPYLSPVILTKYKLKTPARVNLGASVFIGKAGFISGDVELIDYSNAEIQSNDFSPLLDNQQILNNYQSVFNYRIGGEYRLDNVRFRGGYSFNPDPRVDGTNNRKFTTFGVGYKNSDFFMDVAVVSAKSKPSYASYEFSDFALDDGFRNPTVQSKINNTMITLTAGFNF